MKTVPVDQTKEENRRASRYLQCQSWIAVAKLSGPHWNSLSIPPFIAAALAVGTAPVVVIVGSVAGVVLSAIIDLTNRIADRVEDAVDYPYRTPMCERIGYRNLWGVVASLSAVYAICVIVLGLIGIPTAAIVVWAVYFLWAINYSYGLRIKTRRFGSWFAVAAYPSYFLFLGAVQSGTVKPVLLPALLLWMIGLTLVGWKDVNNLAGDETVGFRSIVRVVMLGGSSTNVRSLALVIVPHVFVAAFVFLEFLPNTAWMLFASVPIALIYAVALPKLATKTEAEAVREAGNLYFVVATLAMSWVVFPNLETVLLAAVAVVWWALATHYVNCDPPGLTRRHVSALAGLLLGRADTNEDKGVS